MNLAELKAQNQAEEEAQAATTEEQVELELAVDNESEDEVVETTQETETEVEDGEAATVESEGKQESWMSEEDEEQTIPLQAHINKRNQLKGKLADKDSEIETLRQEIEQLKQSNTGDRPAPTQEIVAPNRYDYDSDEEFQAANSKYIADQVQQQIALQTKTTQAQTQKQALQDNLNNAVNAHYERAEALVKDHGINPDLYKQADLSVRQAVDVATQGQGDLITETLIERLGEGSEKVMYFLGRNESARAKLQSKLTEDPSGLSAMMYLGELKAAKASAQKKEISQAPAPAAQAKQGSQDTSAKALKSKYDKAHSGNNAQEAYNIKKQAKAAGIDTKKW